MMGSRIQPQDPNTKSRDWTVIAMTIMCLSLSYRSVPAGVLEKLAVPARELGEVLARLHTVPGIDEVRARGHH